MKKALPIWNPKPMKKSNRVKPMFMSSLNQKPISFMKPTRIGMPSKKINSSFLGPTKSVDFLPKPKKSYSFVNKGIGMSAYPSKKVSKKNLTWPQAKAKYPKMNPFGDVDKDRVPNYMDCKPFNTKEDGIISNIGKAVARAVAPTVSKAATTISKAYTSVDKSVGGILPGGAPRASTTPTSTASKTTTSSGGGASSSTSTSTSSGGTSSGSGGGGGGVSSSVAKVVASLTPGGTTTSTTPGGTTTSTTPGGTTTSIQPGGAATASLTPGATPMVSYSSIPGWRPANPNIQVIYIDKTGKTTGATTFGDIPSGINVQGTGANWQNLGTKLAESVTSQLKAGTPVTITGDYSYRAKTTSYSAEPAATTSVTPTAPATLKQTQALLQPLAQRLLKPGIQSKQLPTISGAVQITPEQIPYLTSERAQQYPLVLNINPTEKKRPAFVTQELLKLQPRITYNANIPTRLSIIAPIGTTKEIAMANLGASGAKYGEYVINMPGA